MFNLPTHKTPVKQETARRLGTPMRDALVARATQPRPAYLREHTLASPLRSSIVNKSSTVVEMHRSRFGGLPTPVCCFKILNVQRKFVINVFLSF